MKNVQRFLPFLLLALLPFAACKNKCDNDDFGIQSIQPEANPAGYEIFIACTGVSANTKVRFDEVEADSRVTEGGLIAEVPAGVQGSVSLSIEEGDCSASASFDVLGSYPTNTPASPPIIIVPQGPGSYPDGVTNSWGNVFDENHFLFLEDEFDFPDGIFNNTSNEFHITNPYFDQNPISGTYDTLANTVLIEVDRSGKVGGSKEKYSGQFIPNLQQQPTAEATILLTSEQTGRQLVIYKPN